MGDFYKVNKDDFHKIEAEVINLINESTKLKAENTLLKKENEFLKDLTKQLRGA